MKTPTARPELPRFGFTDAQLRRGRDPLPRRAPPLPQGAAHDFLVPNPRPDLIMDRTTLRMLEVP